MKWISCILFLLALGFSAPAYAGGHACCSKKQALAISQERSASASCHSGERTETECDAPRQELPEQHGQCPAGCNCSCCQSAVCFAFPSFETSAEPPRNTYVERRMDTYFFELATVFWHPPRLI